MYDRMFAAQCEQDPAPCHLWLGESAHPLQFSSGCCRRSHPVCPSDKEGTVFPSGPCRSFRCIQVLEPAGGPICVVFLPRAFADVQVRQVPHGPSLLPSSPYPLSYSSPVCAGRCLAGPFSSGCKYAKIAMLTSKVRQMTFAAAEIDSGLSHTRVRGRNTLRGSPGPCRSCCACLQLMFSGGLPVSYSQSINCL